MAEIVRAEIVGTRTAENGSDGYTINSTSYSVLVFYSNGSVDLVEGELHQICQYLPYMHPSDNFDQLMPLLNQLLSQFEVRLKEYFTQTVEDVLFEYRNPLPVHIVGKDLHEAKTILERAGFRVECIPYMPKETSGIVIGCNRKHDDLMTVVLKIKYDIPSVEGMDANLAVKELNDAGFIPIIKKQITRDSSLFNIVYRTEHDDDGLDVVLWVYVEDVFGVLDHIQSCNSMIDIWKAWEKSDMMELYPDVTEFIRTKKEIERMYGRISDISKMKQEIEAMLQRET